MDTEKKRFPVALLLLDLVGSLLIAVGILEMASEGMLIPEPYRFNNYGLIMLLVGMTIMMPFILYIIKNRKC